MSEAGVRPRGLCAGTGPCGAGAQGGLGGGGGSVLPASSVTGSLSFW